MKGKPQNNIIAQTLPPHWGLIDPEFYLRTDVVKIARELLGKILVTRMDGVITAGRISETEAYRGTGDKASHAYLGKRTQRTEIMYAEGGHTYVYLCYGIHPLFNVVTNVAGIPHAVLIRGIYPLAGLDIMAGRCGREFYPGAAVIGPGKVSKALGIRVVHSGLPLGDPGIFIVQDGFKLNRKSIQVTPRIGVGYAQEDARLPYRFLTDFH